ncbi:polar amino acid transport system ATP-binding protein/general L-amino acid transport system ATP-binding protein [Pseudacidovorax sp. 1753]|uniref:amino acid ABC transporter ATP-binding protein n=1 Tax=Pseudacidovorax sp. 1753 TaxID=3156419 RepID=UPI0033973969
MNTQSRAAAPVVHVSGVNKHFGAHQVLHDIHLNVTAGERVVICGPSGSGKSTLARCISGLEPYGSGEVRVNGQSVSPRMRHSDLVAANIGMVFQQFNLFPHLTVLQNCTLAQRWVRRRSTQKARDVAMVQLAKVRLAEKATAYPGQLSGGQQQRVAIARALCLDPSVLIFDEATSALDPEMVKEVLDAMILLAKDGMTMICITHEMGFARAVANKVVFMEAGYIVQQETPNNFFDANADPRIQQFLRSVH